MESKTSQDNPENTFTGYTLFIKETVVSISCDGHRQFELKQVTFFQYYLCFFQWIWCKIVCKIHFVTKGAQSSGKKFPWNRFRVDQSKMIDAHKILLFSEMLFSIRQK